jgi:LPS-assembly protein
MLFRADELDYNEDTGDVQARGNVYFEQFERNEKIWADHLEYNTKTEAGKFYDVRGTPPRASTRAPACSPASIRTISRASGRSAWSGHYILYDGFLTNCRSRIRGGG